MTNEDRINYLVSRKFPHVLNRAPLPHPPNSWGGKVNNEGMEKLIKKVADYKNELRTKSQIQITEIYNKEIEKARIDRQSSYFFNQPHALADFDYWSKMPHWTLDEAIALSFGKNPQVVCWESLNKVYEHISSEFTKEYSKVRELATRALAWQKLYDPVMPQIFIKWAKDNDISVPYELEKKVDERHGQMIDWKNQYDALLEKNNKNVETANKIIEEKNGMIKSLRDMKTEEKQPNPKEKESLLKILLGLSLTNYEFDPRASRNSTAREIKDDLLLHGISVDEDTVRKWLNESKEYLPDNWNSDN